MNRPFWLGVIGCVFGIILVSCAYIFIYIIQGMFGGPIDIFVLLYFIIPAIFSVLGLIASLLDTRKRLGGALMIVAAIGVSLSLFPYGLIPALFFVLGGILKLMERQKMITSVPQQASENIKRDKNN